MGIFDQAAPNTSDSMKSIMEAMLKYMPQYMQMQNQQVLPTELAKLEAAQQTSPGYNQLLLDLYSKYGPEMARIGSQVDATAKAGNVQSNTNLLSQYGPALGQAYAAADAAASPDSARVRSATGNKMLELLGSYNLNAPNVEAERLIGQENARSGTNALPSATNTLSNALMFGDENRKRQDALGRALQLSTAYIPAAKGNFDVGQAITGAGGVNSGTAQFAGVQKPGSESYGMGQDMFGASNDLRNQQLQITADKKMQRFDTASGGFLDWV